MLVAYCVIRGVGYGLDSLHLQLHFDINENYSQLQLCLPFILLVGLISKFSSMSLASSYLLRIEVASILMMNRNY